MNPDALSVIDWSRLDPSILGPAFLAGLLVLATHVPLGQQVLRKGIVFIDLAIAQIAGLGVVLAHSLGWEAQGWQAQAAAMAAALGGAGLMAWLERRWPEVQEALIGALFVLASCLALLLLSHNPHGAEHLQTLLVGQILWVNLSQLGPVAGLGACILLLWFARPRWRSGARFYFAFALAVTASVQLVGVFLVFSSLIMPALAVRHLPAARQLPWAWGAGVLAYLLGLGASALFDLPTGAVIVVALAGVCLALAVALPGPGPGTAPPHSRAG